MSLSLVLGEGGLKLLLQGLEAGAVVEAAQVYVTVYCAGAVGFDYVGGGVQQKLAKRAAGIISRELKKPAGGDGRADQRFLSAVTHKGPLTLWKAAQVYVTVHRAGAVGFDYVGGGSISTLWAMWVVPRPGRGALAESILLGRKKPLGTAAGKN